MTATTARRPASSPTARKPASTTAKSAPKPQPVATIDLGARQVEYWFPQATLANGTVVKCSHQRYGHETEKAARTCIASLVASKGHKAA